MNILLKISKVLEDQIIDVAEATAENLGLNNIEDKPTLIQFVAQDMFDGGCDSRDFNLWFRKNKFEFETCVRKVVKSKGDWKFERSSGYAGYRCQKCKTWEYDNNNLLRCECDKENSPSK